MVKAEPHAVPGAPGQAQVQCPPLGGVLFGPQALRLCYCLSLPALPESVLEVGKVKLSWGESSLGGGGGVQATRGSSALRLRNPGLCFPTLVLGAFKPHVESGIVLFFFLEEIRRGPPRSGSCGP